MLVERWGYLTADSLVRPLADWKVATKDNGRVVRWAEKKEKKGMRWVEQ